MYNKIKKPSLLRLIMIFQLLGGSLVHGTVLSQEPAPIQFKSINLIAGLPKAPFIIEENGRGLQLDIIRFVLSKYDIDTGFTHVPLSRGVTTFRSLNADGVITLPKDYSYPNLYISDPYINYHNVAISLTQRGFEINELADLSTKSVVAFQNARTFMGDEYRKSVEYSMDYREIADQYRQIKMLFQGHAEVIILDLNIFKYFLYVNKSPMFAKEFKVHYLFEPRDYAIGFRDRELRDKFNIGLKNIKDQGDYQKILDKYMD